MKLTVEQLRRFAKAINYYEKLGFKNFEVLWLVSKEANAVTMPKWCRSFTTPIGTLPGSGEQSFIQLMFDGQLPSGRYQALTPCFRDEVIIDELHLQYFLKLELIDTTPEKDYKKMIVEAQEFFASIGIRTEIKETSETSADLKYKQFQLGSYGLRSHKHLSWVYGTGLAEPRASYVWDVISGEKKRDK